MAVRHIVILTRQTNISGLFLLPHSMVEAMAMVKKTPPGHFEPTLLSEKYYPPQNKQPRKNRGSRDGNFSGDMFSCREGTRQNAAGAPQKNPSSWHQMFPGGLPDFKPSNMEAILSPAASWS